MLDIEINEAQAKELNDYANQGIEEQQKKQKYPAIQLNQYKGLQLNTPLYWCFGEESLRLIPESIQAKLKLSQFEVYYSDDENAKPLQMFKPDAALRFIPLAIPKIYKENKTSKKISRFSKFIDGDQTVAKLFLALIIDGQLATNEGLPIVITLKVSSFRTEEIIGKNGSEGSLTALSNELRKRKIGVAGKANIHLINLAITPTTKIYKSKSKGESTRAATYKLESAKLNSIEWMKVITNALTDELRKDILDPFGLEDREGISEEEQKQIIKEEINRFATNLRWDVVDIKNELQGAYGVPDFKNLTIEQLLEFRDYLEGLASLPSH